MINKLALNNEIVKMRKVVRQAIVHVIHKLVREVKKLRERHGPEDVKVKYNRKADRRGEEIMYIKKINKDDVSKFALKNSEDPMEKLSDPNISVEERALFRLASHKSIADKVNTFRAQYPDWKEYISETIDELGSRRKKTAKGSVKLESKRNTSKQQFPLRKIQDKTEKLSKTLPEAGEPKSNVLRQSSVKVNKEIEDSKSNVQVKSSKFLSQWTIQDVEPPEEKSANNHLNELGGKKIGTVCPKKNKWSNRVESGDGPGHNNKRNGVAVIRKFRDIVDEGNRVPDNQKRLKEVEDASNVEDEGMPTSDKEAIDPFFVSSDGKTEYRTSVVIEEDDKEDNVETFKGERRSFGREWDPRNRESHQDRNQYGRDRGPHGRGGHFNRERRGNRGMGPRFGARAESQGNEKSFTRKTGAPIEDEGHLHPSWEAKRKQKELNISNVVFQGKKIKFDDGDD